MPRKGLKTLGVTMAAVGLLVAFDRWPSDRAQEASAPTSALPSAAEQGAESALPETSPAEDLWSSLTLAAEDFILSSQQPWNETNVGAAMSVARAAHVPRSPWQLDPLTGRLQYAPAAVCFAEGTPKEVMAEINRLINPSSSFKYFIGSRWSGLQGTPRALTWSFVPDGTIAGSGLASTLFATLDGQFGGNRALWISRFQQSFDRWQQLTGTSYTRVTDGGNDWDDGASWGSGGSATRGDVRIAMRNIDGPSSILAFNFFPSNGDMVMDSSENWNQSGNSHRFMRNIIMHEHGHGLGISHVCTFDSDQLMEPFLSTAFDGVQHDDLRAGQRHYGDPFEPDDGPADATDLGTPPVTGLVRAGTIPSPSFPNSGLLSIDATGKTDWFRFSTTDTRRVTVKVVPQGRVYQNNPQSGDGSCPGGGSNVDSLAMANLNVEVIDGDETTVLATGASQPAGMTEEVVDLFLPTAGDYFIRVFEFGGTAQSQLYILDVLVNNPLPCQLIDCAESPLVPDFPHNARKNRYLSFDPNNDAQAVAFQIELTAGPDAPAMLGWVGAPYDPSCQKDDGSPLNPPASCAGLDALARIVPDPVIRLWTEPVIHIGDCPIVPTATYALRGSHDGVLFSDPLSLQTIAKPGSRFWADVAGSKVGTTWQPPDEIINVNDVQAALARFSLDPEAPHKTWIDIDGESPNYLINVTDVQQILLAFLDRPYPFSSPAGCP